MTASEWELRVSTGKDQEEEGREERGGSLRERDVFNCTH